MKQMKKDYLNVIKPFIPSILFGFGFMVLVLWLRPSIVWIVFSVLVLTLFFGVRSGKGFKDLVLSCFVNVGFLLIIFFIWKLIGGKGLLGLLGACVVVVGVIIYRRRKLFMSTIREVEKLLWGKTNESRFKRR